MRAGKLSQNEHDESAQTQDWRRLFEGWCERVEACALKPTRHGVHDLRSATLRVQALLDAFLEIIPANAALLRAAQRWSRKAKRARKLLGPVRDADVCLELLRSFRAPSANAAKGTSPGARDSLRVIGLLERALHRRRTAARRRMSLVLEAKQAHLVAAARALGDALAASPAARLDQRTALKSITAQLAAAAPSITPETLHDFRKLAKTARYLAEQAPLVDAKTQHLAAQCKAVQTSVGEWRDWTVLAEFAKQKARHRAGKTLAQDLEKIAGRLLVEALRQCRRSARALACGERPAPRSRPVARTRSEASREVA